MSAKRTDRGILREAIQDTRVEGPVALSGGRVAETYWDVRRALLRHDVLFAAVRRLLALARPLIGDGDDAEQDHPFSVAAVGTGGTLLLGGILLRHARASGVIQVPPKKHGPYPHSKVCFDTRWRSHLLLVDDVATSGKTLRKLYAHVLSLSMREPKVMAVVLLDRQEGAAEVMDRHGIPFRSVFTPGDLA